MTRPKPRRILGPPYYNAFAGILALMLLVLTGVGPLIAWRQASLASLRRQFVVPAAVGVAVTLGIVLLFGLATVVVGIIYAGVARSLERQNVSRTEEWIAQRSLS